VADHIWLGPHLAAPPQLTFRVVFWFPVPAFLQADRRNPDARSNIPDLSAADLAALRAGEYVEVIEDLAVPGTFPTVAALVQAARAAAEARYAELAPNHQPARLWPGQGDSWHPTNGWRTPDARPRPTPAPPALSLPEANRRFDAAFDAAFAAPAFTDAALTLDAEPEPDWDRWAPPDGTPLAIWLGGDERESDGSS